MPVPLQYDTRTQRCQIKPQVLHFRTLHTYTKCANCALIAREIQLLPALDPCHMNHEFTWIVTPPTWGHKSPFLFFYSLNTRSMVARGQLETRNEWEWFDSRFPLAESDLLWWSHSQCLGCAMTKRPWTRKVEQTQTLKLKHKHFHQSSHLRQGTVTRATTDQIYDAMFFNLNSWLSYCIRLTRRTPQPLPTPCCEQLRQHKYQTS